MELFLLRIVVGSLLIGSAKAVEPVSLHHYEPSTPRALSDCGGVSNDECDDFESAQPRSSVFSRSEGDRVSQLDIGDYNCRPPAQNSGEATKRVRVKFYYAIESSKPISSKVVRFIDNEAFDMARPGISLCVKPGVDVGDRRNLEGDPQLVGVNKQSRYLSLEEARRLNVISFSSSPGGTPVDRAVFGTGLDPCLLKKNTECEVIQGQMTIVARKSDGLGLMEASIFDTLEALMDKRKLFLQVGRCTDEDTCSVTSVSFLGVTFEEVIEGVMIEIARRGGDNQGPVVVATGQEEQDSENGSRPRVLYYAAVPMAVLLLFALLLAKNKHRREVKTPAQLVDIEQDHVIVGTGDPPRCFHEGLYHYTRSGARYLSTNCADCAETRRIGFFKDGDLPTISEGRLYDPESPSAESLSYDEISCESEEEDPSDHRKNNLVKPSSQDLGNKHSCIDVHHCTSATCRICAYRPRDVSFVSSPAASPAGKMFSSQDGLGESCIV